MDQRFRFLSHCIVIVVVLCASAIAEKLMDEAYPVREGTVQEPDGGERRAIYYGTSQSYCGQDGGADEGEKENVEACCSEQSKCAVKIGKGKQRWGAKNIVGVTIFDCKCEDKFRDCLKSVGEKGAKEEEQNLAEAIRAVYFDLVPMPCVIVTKEADKGEKEIAIDKDSAATKKPKAYFRVNNGKASAWKFKPNPHYPYGWGRK